MVFINQWYYVRSRPILFVVIFPGMSFVSPQFVLLFRLTDRAISTWRYRICLVRTYDGNRLPSLPVPLDIQQGSLGGSATLLLWSLVICHLHAFSTLRYCIKTRTTRRSLAGNDDSPQYHLPATSYHGLTTRLFSDTPNRSIEQLLQISRNQ